MTFKLFNTLDEPKKCFYGAKVMTFIASNMTDGLKVMTFRLKKYFVGVKVSLFVTEVMTFTA